MDVECPLIPVPLQVNLLTPPCEGDSSPVLELICLLWDFTPNEAKVEWLVNGIKKDLPGTVYSSAEGTNGLFMGQSRVNISRESWNKEDVYTCKVSHPALSTDYEMRNASKCIPNRCDPRPVEVFLYPPSLEDIFVAHNTTITCLVTNLETPSNLEISWSRGSKGTLDVVTGKPVQQQNSTYSVTSILRVCAEEWKSGEQFTCTVKHPGIPSAITKSIHKTKATNLQAPSVYVYPPSADELSLQEVATLTCLAKGFRPSDIMVTWTQQGRPVSQETFINVGPVQDTAEKELNYFIYSKLSVLTNEWQRGDIFACVVGHEGLPMTFVQKSVDKASGKPTAVNVSVVLSDTEITCY
ncbi:hypothetical protein Y1Q_0005955 [Alligator mississippiensis]|uniref:Ig-like domain-containing protein n=1 Tax=Alligator mississippiensis TaxID=8496 RepID=A0A151MZ12_ALLMI|nr:hypothetical protein Y1Q_0005955 [Alligator mississippiensis]